MKTYFLTKYDIDYHFKKNSGFYIGFVAIIFISIVISTIIIISSDAYLNLIISKNKIFYSLVNGNGVLKEIFWGRLNNFLFPVFLVCILGLNYYVCLLSYLVIGYQFSIFILTIYAVISLYGFSGLISCLFLIIPLNLLVKNYKFLHIY